MYRKLKPLLVLFTTVPLLGMHSAATASETREDVIKALRATELQVGSTEDLSDKELNEVALLANTLEAKRDNYARALELYIERIGAGKDVDKALFEYERAEISLAAEWKATRKVLEVIKNQDHLAHVWKHHRSVHPDQHDNRNGHRSSVRNADHRSYSNSTDANKSEESDGSYVFF